MAVTNLNIENGLTIHITTLSTSNRNYTLHVPNQSLPLLECGENYYKCNILIFDYNKVFYVVIPSIGGFVWVEYTLQGNKQPVAHFQRVSRPCSPTKLYYGGGVDDFRVIISCFNLTAQSGNQGSLYYIDFLYSVLNNVTTFYERLSSDREPIFGLDTVSMAIRATNLFVQGCFSDEEMYVFDEGYPLHTTTEPTRLNPSFIEETPLENCQDYYHVEYNEKGGLVLYCTNQTAIVYHICTGQASYFVINTTGIPYFCSVSSDYTIYRHSNKLLFKDTGRNVSTEIDFNYPNIIFGKCVATATEVYFLGLTSNNILLRVSESSQSAKVIVTDVCSQNKECLRPQSRVQETVYSYYNPATSIIEVFNSSNGQELPEIQVPFHPVMYTIYTDPVTYISCDKFPSNNSQQTTTPNIITKATTEQISFAITNSFSCVLHISTAVVILLCL